jgi:hypothetical protein
VSFAQHFQKMLIRAYVMLPLLSQPMPQKKRKSETPPGEKQLRNGHGGCWFSFRYTPFDSPSPMNRAFFDLQTEE